MTLKFFNFIEPVDETIYAFKKENKKVGSKSVPQGAFTSLLSLLSYANSISEEGFDSIDFWAVIGSGEDSSLAKLSVPCPIILGSDNDTIRCFTENSENLMQFKASRYNIFIEGDKKPSITYPDYLFVDKNDAENFLEWCIENTSSRIVSKPKSIFNDIPSSKSNFNYFSKKWLDEYSSD